MPWNKLAAIGDWNTVFPLKAIGIDVFPIEEPSQAPKILTKISRDNQYGVIFISEDLAEFVQKEMRQLAWLDLPAVILIPHVSGSKGLGLSVVRETMKKAAGRDILSDSDAKSK